MKKLITLSLVGVLGVILGSSAALANYGENNSLAGYVKEYATLIPLSGARVKLYTRGGSYKDSDMSSLRGKYKFSDLKEGTYRVRTSKTGYRNPVDMKKNIVSKTVKVDGPERKNLYLQKI